MNAAFPLDTGVIDPPEFRGNSSHLFPDLFGIVVVETGRELHTQTRLDSLAQVTQDLPVCTRLAHRRDGRAAALNAAIRVGKCRIFFSEACGGQDHVRHFPGFVDENVLTDQELELLQGMAGMVLIGFAHHRVFAQNEHGAHRTGNRAVHHLRRGQTRLRVELNAPVLFKAFTHDRICDRLVCREDVR